MARISMHACAIMVPSTAVGVYVDGLTMLRANILCIYSAGVRHALAPSPVCDGPSTPGGGARRAHSCPTQNGTAMRTSPMPPSPSSLTPRQFVRPAPCTRFKDSSPAALHPVRTAYPWHSIWGLVTRSPASHLAALLLTVSCTVCMTHRYGIMTTC